MRVDRELKIGSRVIVNPKKRISNLEVEAIKYPFVGRIVKKENDKIWVLKTMNYYAHEDSPFSEEEIKFFSHPLSEDCCEICMGFEHKRPCFCTNPDFEVELINPLLKIKEC